MNRFDEKQLVGQLDRLPNDLRAAFAAACAERLLPAYSRFVEATGDGDPASFRGLLDRLWADLSGDRMSTAELDATVASAAGLEVDEDSHAKVSEMPSGSDAAAALSYALRCRKSSRSQDAAWAARRAFEAADHFVHESIDDDAQATSHPVVQSELARQIADVALLLEARSDTDRETALQNLKTRSQTAASTFFSPS